MHLDAPGVCDPDLRLVSQDSDSALPLVNSSPRDSISVKSTTQTRAIRDYALTDRRGAAAPSDQMSSASAIQVGVRRSNGTMALGEDHGSARGGSG